MVSGTAPYPGGIAGARRLQLQLLKGRRPKQKKGLCFAHFLLIAVGFLYSCLFKGLRFNAN